MFLGGRRRRARLFGAALGAGVTVAWLLTVNVSAPFSDQTPNASSSLTAATLAPATSVGAADVGSLQVDLWWTASASLWSESYNIYRSTSPGCCHFYVDNVVGQATVTYTDTVPSGDDYYYVLQAIAGSWGSVVSDEAAVTVVGPTVSRIGDWQQNGGFIGRVVEAGTDRALVVVVAYEHDFPGDSDPGPAPSLSSLTYGGEAMSWAAGWTMGFFPGPFVRAEIWVLDEAGIAAAVGTSFLPVWDTTPDNSWLASAVYDTVSQPGLTGAWAFGSAPGPTPNPVTTFGMSTAQVDLVVIAAVAGTAGSYTAQNGFTLGLSLSGDGATLGTAEKAGTGSFETGSMQHDGPDQQVIVGVVLEFAP